MTREKGGKAVDRRSFLSAIGSVSTTAAAAAASMPMTEAQAYDPGADETKGRYRETDHVRAFIGPTATRR
jgi:hypothetical protein